MPRKVTKKDQILKTAADLLSTFGYKSIGIDTIVEKSKVAKMTLYSHYKSKEKLIEAILDYKFIEITEKFKELFEKHSKKQENKKVAIINTAKELINSDDFKGFTFLNFAIECPDLNSEVYQQCQEYLKQFQDMLHKMMKSNDTEAKFIVQTIFNASLMKTIEQKFSSLDYLKKNLK
jgi:hypothetical protein